MLYPSARHFIQLLNTGFYQKRAAKYAHEGIGSIQRQIKISNLFLILLSDLTDTDLRKCGNSGIRTGL